MVLRCVLAVWGGIPLLVVGFVAVSVGGGLAFGWRIEPAVGPRHLVTVVHLCVLAVLVAGYVKRRPLDRTDRGYYRMALWVIGMFGLMTTWFLGARWQQGCWCTASSSTVP